MEQYIGRCEECGSIVEINDNQPTVICNCGRIMLSETAIVCYVTDKTNNKKVNAVKHDVDIRLTNTTRVIEYANKMLTMKEFDDAYYFYEKILFLYHDNHKIHINMSKALTRNYTDLDIQDEKLSLAKYHMKEARKFSSRLLLAEQLEFQKYQDRIADYRKQKQQNHEKIVFKENQSYNKEMLEYTKFKKKILEAIYNSMNLMIIFEIIITLFLCVPMALNNQQLKLISIIVITLGSIYIKKKIPSGIKKLNQEIAKFKRELWLSKFEYLSLETSEQNENRNIEKTEKVESA